MLEEVARVDSKVDQLKWNQKAKRSHRALVQAHQNQLHHTEFEQEGKVGHQDDSVTLVGSFLLEVVGGEVHHCQVSNKSVDCGCMVDEFALRFLPILGLNSIIFADFFEVQNTFL